MAEAVVSIYSSGNIERFAVRRRQVFSWYWQRSEGATNAAQIDQVSPQRCRQKAARKRKIRDLAYRAEDVIASYAVRASSDARGRGLKRVFRRFSGVLRCCSLHQLDHEISDIKSELARVTKSMQDYGIRSIIDRAESSWSAANDNQNWTRKTFPSFEIGDCFMGREDEMKQLGSLVGSDKQHRVISVWGMGGIGKTTIVKKVYNTMSQTRKFDSLAYNTMGQHIFALFD